VVGHRQGSFLTFGVLLEDHNISDKVRPDLRELQALISNHSKVIVMKNTELIGKMAPSKCNKEGLLNKFLSSE
jgi:hypothetical protein